MLNILIPTDFSPNALRAAEYAITLFGADANYMLLNTFEVPHSGATMLISIADILEKDSLLLLTAEHTRLVEIFPKMEDRIRVKTMMGSPSVCIKKSADLQHYDFVVMGTKGATGLKGILIGSVASNTMSDVTCPVIAIPEEAPLSLPKRILLAADDKCLNEGKLPDGLAALAQRFDAEVFILNVVAKGDLAHVGNRKGQDRAPIGVFEGVKHTFHFIEDDQINNGIELFMKEHQVDLLAMITRRDDLFSRLFGRSNTKNMMMNSSVVMAAFH